MVIFEDLQWIDEETQAFLNLLAEAIANAPVLLLVTYRPEYSHHWGSKTYYTQLRVDPLGKENAEEMLSTLLGDGAELLPLKRVIIEKTEGNPLFMEELVEALFEEGVLVRNGAINLTRPLGQVKIPPTVLGILAARIDRLPPEAKELLQTLAVVGSMFPLSLVREVSEQPPEQLDRLLDGLQAGEFIYEQPAIGGVEYTFKHALTRQVADESLLSERRELLHQRTGQAIEALYHERLDDHYTDLAHHYRHARDTEKAVHFMRRAAEQAVARSAFSEGEAQLQDAIALILTLPPAEKRDRTELGLQTTLGALLVGRSFGAQEREAPLRRASELCERVTDLQALLPALFQIGQFYIERLRLSEARGVAERAITLAQTLDDPLPRITAWHNLGETHFWSGEPLAACTHFERAFALYENISPPALLACYGMDTWIATASNLAGANLILGKPEKAISLVMRVAERARDSSQPFSKAAGFSYGMWPAALIRGNHDYVRSHIAQARHMTDEYGFPEIRGWALMFDAYARFWQGEREAGLSEMKDAVKDLDAVSSLIFCAWRLAMLAEMYLELGNYLAAETTLSEAFSSVARTSERWCESEVYRVAGELMRRKPGGDIAIAAEQYRQSIEIALAQQAKWWELRATMSLARLLAEQGNRDQARAMLAEIYNWFSEGFDTADLRDAKALLDELNQ
jgi:tetratricopeptide (TPR) repeat protein